MDMKRLVCGAMAAAMLAAPAMAAGEKSEPVTPMPISQNETAPEKAPYTLAQWEQLMPVRYSGQIVTLEEGSLLLKKSGPGVEEVLLHVSEQTRILDAVTGESRSMEDLKKGESLAVWTSPMMTMSLPPQSNAQVIVCGIPADYQAPTYTEIQQVEKNEDGSISVLTSDDVVLHIKQDTQIFPYLTKNVVTMDSLRPGDRILAWHDMVMQSYPAQAYPTKVMVFPYGYEGWLRAATADDLVVNGEELEVDGLVVDGKLLLPLRAVAEALDCDVQWKAEEADRVNVFVNGTLLYRLNLDANTVVVDGDEVHEMDSTTVIHNGLTYMDADKFIELHGLKAEGQWPGLF